jgi:ketosteroid isomerase-like protein
VSQENVEIARQYADAYNGRDVEAFRMLNDPNVELDWSRSTGWMAGVYAGIDAVLAFWAGYFEAFEEIVIEPESYLPVGDAVVVPNVGRMRGRDGVEVTAHSTIVLTIRNGKIASVCLYQARDEAFNAVGLEE